MDVRRDDELTEMEARMHELGFVGDSTPTPLLGQVLKHLIEHPEEHNQATWFRTEEECGTVGCVAGWACYMAGARMATDRLGWTYLLPEPEDGEQDFIRVGDVGVEAVYVHDRAKRVLGLSESDATAMFAGDNDMEHLLAMAAALGVDLDA